MGKGFKVTGVALAGALLMTSVAAEARPRWGGGGWGGNGGWHHRGRDRVDAGDIFLGALLIGGILAVASSANKNKSRSTGSSSARGPSGANTEDAAVDACAEAAEREANRNDSNARVEEISNVSRDGEGWRVEGVVVTGNEGSYRDSRSFTCATRYGRVDFVQLGGEVAYAR